GFPLALGRAAGTRVVRIPSLASCTDQSSCAVHTPIDPTAPDGVTTSSSACTAIQYAAEAASAFATAVVGVDAFRTRSAVSGTSSTDPPGDATSSTMCDTFGSASNRRNVEPH